MGDVSVVETAVTRQLQHAILQLCNEHVSYEHTLQVLGVVCVIVDDQPRDLVVKLNNTLKRVDAAVPPASDDRRVGTVRTSAPALWPRVDATAACSSSTATGSSTAGYGDPPPDRRGSTACTEAGPVATVIGNSSLRKCHGRKQSNPVKVKTVMDDDDEEELDNDDLDYSTSDYRAGGVLLIAPAEPSASEDDPSVVTSPPSSPRLLRSIGGQHRDIDEELPQRGRRHVETPTPGISESSAVRTLLSGLTENNDSADDVLHRSCTDVTPDLTEYRPSDSVADKLRQDRASVDVQEAALNFSTRTLDQAADSDTSPSAAAASNIPDVKIKDEVQHPALPISYGLELGGGHGGRFDMSRSMSVAAAAAAFSQYVDDPNMLQSLTSYDQQRLALYTSLVTAAAASAVPPVSCDNEQARPVSLLNGAGPDGADLPSSTLDRPLAMSSYVMSGRLGDGLTMHRLPAIRRRERFDRGLHHAHQPPMKVCT